MRVKIFQSFLYVFLASILASSAYAAECTPTPTPNEFEVYIHTNYKNQPDLSQYGAKNVEFIYAQNFWSTGQDLQLLPSKTKVTSYVAGKYANYTGLLVLDIEHWPLIGSNAQVASRVTKHITVFDWVKAAAPKATIGYYSVIPRIGYWQCQDPDSAMCITWKADQNKAQALANTVDAFFPALYPVEANQDNWVAATTAHITEAQRLGKGKPVYPVINPRYHAAAYNGLAFDPVPKDFFRLQLDTAKDLGAAGVLVWGWDLYTKDWGLTQGANPSHGWWQATKEFLDLN